MRIVYFLLYIYLLLRPYYFFKSGGVQFSDIFLILAFFLFILFSKFNKKRLLLPIEKNKELFIFTILTFFINGIYFIIFLNFKFILSSLYYVFNLFAIILFFNLFAEKKQLNTVGIIFKLNLLLQLLFYLLNVGKYYDLYRYMGTFNDPNQFGFYVLLSFSYIYIINNITDNKKYQFVFFIISIFLIFQCASTGMILGILVFFILMIINNLKNINNFINQNKNKLFFALVSLLFIGIFIGLTGKNQIVSSFLDSEIISRVEDKLNRKSASQLNGQMSIWQERGYDKLVIYPQYLLYGSGEGEYNRFYKSAHTNEIHATLPSILFYYGLIPFLLIVYWLYKRLKNIPPKYKVIYYAILIESFSLLNQRQALFWCIFIIPFELLIENKEEKI